jgi:hypothetical protein
MINSAGRTAGPVRWPRMLGRLISLSVIIVGLLSYFIARYVQLGVRGRALWRETPRAAQLSAGASPAGAQAAGGSQ